MCNRVAIVVRGQVKATGSLAQLRAGRASSTGKASVRVLASAATHAKALRGAKISNVKVEGDRITFEATEVETAKAVSALVQSGAQIVSVQQDAGSLESIFLGITEES